MKPRTTVEAWVMTCAARTAAMQAAADATASTAAVARMLAGSARRRGDDALAAQLEGEAQAEDREAARLREMLDGLDRE